MSENNEKFVLGKSRQAVALAKKALSYQKRQTFTNVCCISLCPLIMVAISAFLGNLISGLISRASPPDEYVYCSNVNGSNPINIPYWRFADGNLTKTPRSEVKGATLESVFNANWAVVRSLSTTGPPGAASAGFKRPCVFWYGEDYPISKLYERNSTARGTRFARDSTYLAQPLDGWLRTMATLNPALVDILTINVFNGYQQRTWVLYSAAPSVDLSLIGSKPKRSDFNLTQFFTTVPNGSPFPPANSTTGLLGTLPTRYFLQTSSTSQRGFGSASLLQVPWYNQTTATPNELDDLISTSLQSVIQDIAKLDKSGINGGNGTAQQEVFLKAAKVLEQLPHGALYFNRIDHAAKRYSWNYHFGSDIRLTAASNFPAVGRRLLVQQTMLDNAVLRNSDLARFSSAQITQGLRILPQLANTEIKLAFGGIIGAILYPFGVSFLLPIFAIVLVQEKENRILVMMKMNGMKSYSYYISHYVTFFILYTVSSLIFLISGGVAKLTMFTLTDKGLLTLLFFLWGNNQISLAFFFSTLFNKSRFALVIVFLIVLCSVIISLVIDQLFLGSSAPAGYFVWPPFAFYRALGLINRASYTEGLRAYDMSMLRGNDEVLIIILFLLFEIPVYLGVAFYLEAVFPTEFGVRKPWHFPLTEPIKAYKKYQKAKLNGGASKSEAELAIGIQIDEAETKFEDADVKAERARVTDPNFSHDGYPLVMKNMRKVYAGRGGAGPKLAVKDVSFAVEKGITFGLLGPNGAGKTTLISILTGLYEASTGHATLAGFDIKTETNEVYKCIGICPQFDIQWEELTVGEHLYFYARLKGISAQDEKKAVAKALKNVSLTDFEDRLTKGLSGGEKRRLSIAIALLGDPAVVFLDEPTTGLDPEVRRLIWNIVNEARLGRTIVLTTHSMEEAEALCQRIGIMAKGTLRCLANPTRLKEVYGSGFKLYVNSNEEDTPKAAKYIEDLLPAGWKKIDSFATNTSYEFPPVKGILSTLFETVEKGREANGILDWGIGQTTLEEVFIRLISEADASAEY